MDKETRDELDKVHERISNLRQRLTIVETDLPYIRRGVDDIKGEIKWLLRLIVGGILGVALTFAMSGGFKLPPLPV